MLEGGHLRVLEGEVWVLLELFAALGGDVQLAGFLLELGLLDALYLVGHERSEQLLKNIHK